MASRGRSTRGYDTPSADLDDRAPGGFMDYWRPEEGWLSLPLVALLAGSMAWSFADARWILGRDDLTSFLLPVGLAAALSGYVSSRLRLAPWLAQALGCVIGAFIVIEAVGASLPDSQPGLVGWFQATTNSVTGAYLDLVWRHLPFTTQAGHFCLALGVLVWGTAQAASYDIFGYRRSVNGVLLLGVVLLANMVLTRNDQYAVLVVFSAAALGLLLMAHSADQRESWIRHRIWIGRDFQTPHVQGGVAFASTAIAAAMILTFLASSAPLAGAMSNVGQQAQDQLAGLAGWLPGGGNSRVQPGDDFGSTSQISSSFNEAPRNVFTVRVDTGPGATHWRLAVYDDFQGVSWAVGAGPSPDRIASGHPLGAGTLDSVDRIIAGRTQTSVDIHLQDTSIKHLIAGDEPLTVNANVTRTLIGDSKSGFNVAGYTLDASDYTVAGFVPNEASDGSGLTEWRLRHAGTDFPNGIVARYTQGVSDVGKEGKALLNEIAGWAKSKGVPFTTEYDVAKAVQDYLKGSAFTYNIDITPLMSRCTGLSTVDCFAVIRQGFCEQYATTMTMFMRMKGFPARYVLGYLPGPPNSKSPFNQVTNQQKHAWVEVYFPTYGWIPFDPTGGGVGKPTELVAGSAVVATPTPLLSAGPTGSSEATDSSETAATTTGEASTSGDGGGPLVLVPAALVLVLLFGLLLIPWRRRSVRGDDPGAVYRSVVGLASRLGYRPTPTQTIFEYTDMLAEAMPAARESLAVVALAQVEVTYGKRHLSTERLAFLAAAHRTVRNSLLGLALRIPRFSNRGRKRDGDAGTRRGSGGPRG